MAAPAFIAASVGTTDSTGAWTHTAAAPGAIGRFYVVHVLRDGTSATIGITSVTNAENLAGTDGVLTAANFSAGVGNPLTGAQVFWFGRSTSTSAMVITGTNDTGDDIYVRVYEFRDVNAGTTIAEILENIGGTSNLYVSEAGTSATVADAAVTTSAPDRFALNFIGITDDNAISFLSGETGGDWQLMAAYADAGGTDGAIGIQGAHLFLTGYTTSPDGATDVAGSGGSEEEIAQSFSLSVNATIKRIHLWPNKIGTPTDNLIVEIQTDSGGLPSGTVVGTGASVAASSLPTGTQSSLYPTLFPVLASLTSGVTYWVVARRSGSRDINNKAQIARNQTEVYAGGTRAIRTSGTWSTALGGDVLFAVSEATGTINGGTFTQADANDGWGTLGFALIGTTVEAPPTSLPLPNRNMVAIRR